MTSPVVQPLLDDAALLALLARAFAYPTPATHAATAALFGRVRAPRGERALFAAARRAWAAADPAAMAGEYMRLFLGGGACPLHETAYGDGRRIAGRPVELADVQGFYRAFGVGPADANPELPDHLCSELEFLSLLAVKQAYARHADWPARAAVARRAAAAFLRDHLGRWVPALAARIAEHDGGAPYPQLAALLAASIARQCRRRRVSPTAVSGVLPHDPMQDDVLQCPRAAATT